MAERPLLILPTAEAIGPPRLPGGGAKPIVPARGTQANRIAPSLRRLKAALNRGPERVLELRADPTALAPDRVIVFEIAGTVADFSRAAARVPGLELMVEYETESAPDEFFAEKDTRKGREGQRREDKLVDGRFYLAMPDVAALDEFIRLWDRWVAGKELDVGLAPFKHMFAQLRTVRPWGPQDRIPDETIAYWSEEARRHPNRPVRTEVELWHRRTPQRREQARLAFRALVAAEGGTVLNEALIPEIAYQGVLIDIPAAAIQALVARGNVALALADDVMFFVRKPSSRRLLPTPLKTERRSAISPLPPVNPLPRCSMACRCRVTNAWPDACHSTILTTCKPAPSPTAAFTARRWRR